MVFSVVATSVSVVGVVVKVVVRVSDKLDVDGEMPTPNVRRCLARMKWRRGIPTITEI